MKKQFLFGLLAAGFLSACSSDDSQIGENIASNEYGMIEGQPAFLSLGIAMPGGDQTRANDDFEDGIESEYVVKNGWLVLFKGSSEASAKFFKKYEIPVGDLKETGKEYFPMESSTQITSTSKKYVQEIDAPYLSASEKLYAYVILNDNGISLPTSGTFEDFSTTVFKAIGLADAAAEAKGYGAMNATKGLVMTSVPFSTKQGGSADPTGATIMTLTPIEASAVYDTKAKAEASTTSTCIYVERAAAKVQVTLPNDITDPVDAAKKVSFLGWCLGNTNNSTTGYYNTRQVDAAWLPYFNEKSATATPATKYRFVCVSPFFSTGHTMGYRTYFGYDVNYDSNTGLTNGEVLDTDHSLASEACTYTYENTFDENSQIFANTTYVSIKAKLNGGNDFYIIETARNTPLDVTNLKNKLGANVGAQLATQIDEIVAKIETAINTDLALTTPTLGTGITSVTFNLKHEVTLGTKDADAHVPYTDKLVLDEVKFNTVDATAAQLAALNALYYEAGVTIATKLSANLTGYTPDVVTMYQGGVAYYAVRIAHFGDEETLWSAPNSAYNNYDLIYPTNGKSKHTTGDTPDTPITYGASREAAWLGRWGVVRNNWYSLTVNDVVGVGDAVPVDYSGTGTGEPGTTPDDNPDPKYFIAAHVHIVPWVLREQGVVLK